MFEQIVRGALWFAVATYAIGTIKSLTLALTPNGDRDLTHVMMADPGRKPVIYPTVVGTDVPIPFSDGIRTASRVVGASKVYYAVHDGMQVRDRRYKSFWR